MQVPDHQPHPDRRDQFEQQQSPVRDQQLEGPGRPAARACPRSRRPARDSGATSPAAGPWSRSARVGVGDGAHQPEETRPGAGQSRLGARRPRPRHPTRMTCRLRGPCTPSTRSSSMSPAADGPLIQVCGSCGLERGACVCTSATTWSARTMHMCRSGTSVRARRPWPARWPASSSRSPRSRRRPR